MLPVVTYHAYNDYHKHDKAEAEPKFAVFTVTAQRVCSSNACSFAFKTNNMGICSDSIINPNRLVYGCLGNLRHSNSNTDIQVTMLCCDTCSVLAETQLVTAACKMPNLRCPLPKT